MLVKVEMRNSTRQLAVWSWIAQTTETITT